jgi:hypothetical protein
MFGNSTGNDPNQIGGQNGMANIFSGGFANFFDGGGINSILDPAGLFSTPPNPADAAMPYFNQIPGAISPYLNPYIDAGRMALPTLMNQYGNLLNNPTGVMNSIGSTFQQSPGYQFQTNQALGAANRAAAAGGMAGSQMEQQNIAGTVNNLANQDYYNYLNHGMDMYSQGLSGLSGINQMGYGASNNMADDLMSMLMSQAQLAYAGQADQNQAAGGMKGDILGAAGSIIGAFL